MASSNSRNSILGKIERPGSARKAMKKDPLIRNDSPATSSVEVDLGTLIDATAALQTVDLHGLRRRLNQQQYQTYMNKKWLLEREEQGQDEQLQSTVPDDLKNGEDKKDASIGRADNVDWKKKYTDLKEKYDTLTAHLKATEQTSLELKSELGILQQRAESDSKSLKSLKQKLKECMNELKLKEQRLQTIQKAKQEAEKTNDDALARPTCPMGQQMSEGDPNIPDLSDQNRPSKLGEIYSELYDNEWTNAFEVLTETFHLDDKSAIELLLKILWESSKHACVVSQSTMKTIENLLSGSSEGPTPDCKRLLREARKHVDIKKADGLFQDFVREKATNFVAKTHLGEERVKLYSEKCFKFCWMMSIQDPPVVLSKDPERGAHFDTNLYKHYTNSGDNVDYVVWPALLLRKDGPLLVKGVAQPSPRPRVNSAPAVGRSTARDDKSLDRRSQTQYDEKVRESTSRSDRMDKTQYGYQADATLSSKSGHGPMVTQTYSADGGKYRVHSPTPTARAQMQVSGRMQLDQPHVFRNEFDRWSFERFCQNVPLFDNPQLRKLYGTDYDRYYTLYVNQMYGNYKFV